MRSSAWANSVAPPSTVALLLAAIAAAVLIAAAALRGMQPSVRVELLPADDAAVALNRQITAEFGMQNPVVWVIEARDGTVWTPALLGRIQAVTRDVLRIPGVIALDVVSLASPNLRDLRVTEDSMEPVYLMAEVPQSAEEIAALRQRVDSNPNYGGTLVARDGRAAMVVGNFVNNADAQAVAAAALALRERYSDALARLAVTGAPVLRALAPAAARPLAIGALATLLVGFLVLLMLGGWRVGVSAALSAALAVVVASVIVVVSGSAVLPWSAYALLPTALAAAAVATAPPRSWRARLELGVALATAFVALGVVAGAPVAAYGIAGAVGVGVALVLGQGVGTVLRCPARAPRYPLAVGLATLAVVVVAPIGVIHLRTSFGAFGYGTRYLPASAAEDLQVLAHHFPPPTALAIRFRGDPGFVASPQVLNAFDALTAAVRSDPAVVRALSLADLVKMVHRAFNENREEFYAIPDDPGLIARYLALAYSPGFRTFVDRGFTRSALWVYLASDRPADLARVLGKLKAQLAAQPVPTAQVDLAGGDGAVILSTARTARRLAAGTAVFLLLSALGIGVLRGVRSGAAALACGVAAAVLAAGAFGWLGVRIDLVSLPCVIGAAAAGSVFGALGGAAALAPALLVMALLGLVGAFAGAGQLAAVAAVVCGALGLASIVIAGVLPVDS
jgi:uncharacterized protein